MQSNRQLTGATAGSLKTPLFTKSSGQGQQTKYYIKPFIKANKFIKIKLCQPLKLKYP